MAGARLFETLEGGQLFPASAVPANDRECPAQKCKGTGRLSRVNLGRRHSTTTLIVLSLIVIALALVVLTECS